MIDAHIYEELSNICLNQPLFPGDTISHATANACVEREWAIRGDDGCFRPTPDGVDELQRWTNE